MINRHLIDLEAEQAVIGACLISADALTRIISVGLLPEDFSQNNHTALWASMCEMHTNSMACDAITLGDHLGKSKKGHASELVCYAIDLANNTPGSANAEAYADIVMECATARKVFKAGQQITALAEKGTDALIGANRLIQQIQPMKADTLTTISSCGNEFLDELQARYEKGNTSRVKTGIAAIDKFLGGGLEPSLYILAARPSMGKELTNDSPVLLYDGRFKPIGDIMVGDIVASVDGKGSVVTGHFPQGKKPVYRVTFSDGRFVDAGLDHQWEVCNRKWQSPRVMTTRELIEKIKQPSFKSRLFIPNHSSDFGVDQNLTIHPYLLGVLIGNGSFTGGGVKLSTNQEHILNKINSMLLGCRLVEDFAKPRSGSKGRDFRISGDGYGGNKVLSELKSIGLHGKKSIEKFIPENYLSASKEARIDLIRGLIDTDGSVGKNGSMMYSTSSEKLCNDFALLARSLGAYATISSKIPTYTYNGETRKGQRSYCIHISCDNYGEFVTVPSKKIHVNIKQNTSNLNIESIEYQGESECSCISVSHPRALYLTKDYIVTHNSALALQIALDISVNQKKRCLFFSLEMPRRVVMERAVAHLSRIPFDRIRDPKPVWDGNTQIGGMLDEDWPKVTLCMSRIKGSPLIISDGAAQSPVKIIAQAQRSHQKEPLSCIVVDYTLLMNFGNAKSEQELRQALSNSLKMFVALYKELKVPVVLLHQLNRANESRSDKRPIMSDLAATGAIEQDADCIIFPHREGYYESGGASSSGLAEIIFAKNRNGSTGTVPLDWEGQYQNFGEWKGQWPIKKQQETRKSVYNDTANGRR